MPPDDLIACTRDEIARDIALALAVLRPPVQIGHRRKRPGEADVERQAIATMLVRHFERSGVMWFRRAPAPWHSTPIITKG